LIRNYVHLGVGIEYSEAERLKGEIMTALRIITEKQDVDSPVYTFLPQLQPPSLERALRTSHEAGVAVDDAGAVQFGVGGALGYQGLTALGSSTEKFSTLLESFREAKREDDFLLARKYLEKLRDIIPGDPYLIQQHALAVYKSRQPSVLESLKEAHRLLQQLDPNASADPETLGLWGAVHKRLWDETRDRSALDEGIAAYERGFYMKRDYYTGINYVYMLDERANEQTDPEEAIADRVNARRVARQLLTIVGTEIDALPHDKTGTAQDQYDLYWRKATWVEALLVLDDPRFAEARDALYALAPEPWMRKSTEEQFGAIARQKASLGSVEIE
jgi:hypothetical protein